MLCQYRLVNKFHQSIQVRRLEGEADRVVINDLDAFHMVGSAVMVSVSAQQSGGKLIIALAKIGMAGGFIGERHILSSKSLTIMPLDVFLQVEGVHSGVLVDLIGIAQALNIIVVNIFGQKTVIDQENNFAVIVGVLEGGVENAGCPGLGAPNQSILGRNSFIRNLGNLAGVGTDNCSCAAGGAGGGWCVAGRLFAAAGSHA